MSPVFFFQCEQWMREGSQLLINIGRRAPECKKPDQADELIKSLERYVEQGKPHQEQRLQKISELAIDLYGKYSNFLLINISFGFVICILFSVREILTGGWI